MKIKIFSYILVLFLLGCFVFAQEINPLVYDYRREVPTDTITLDNIVNENLDQILKTKENLKIERAFIAKGKKTEVKLKLTPSAVLTNVKLYEEVPKSAVKSTDEIKFKAEPTKIINKDPLIMWNFEELNKAKEISYEINKSLEDINKEEFRSAAIADNFGEKLSPKKNLKLLLTLSSTLVVIIFVLLFFIRLRFPTEKPPQDYSQPRQYTNYNRPPFR